MAGRWFSPGTPVFSTNKTDRHDITAILLKVALNTINQTITTVHEKQNAELHNIKFTDFMIIYRVFCQNI